jgi:hypothetical protein
MQVVDPQTVRVHPARPSGVFLSRVAGTFQAIIPPRGGAGAGVHGELTGPGGGEEAQAKMSVVRTSTSGKAWSVSVAVPATRVTSR